MDGASSLALPSRNSHVCTHQSALDWWLGSLPQKALASSPISEGGAVGGVDGFQEVGTAL